MTTIKEFLCNFSYGYIPTTCKLTKKTIPKDMSHLPDSVLDVGSSMFVKPQMRTKSPHKEHPKYILLVSQVYLNSFLL